MDTLVVEPAPPIPSTISVQSESGALVSVSVEGADIGEAGGRTVVLIEDASADDISASAAVPFSHLSFSGGISNIAAPLTADPTVAIDLNGTVLKATAPLTQPLLTAGEVSGGTLKVADNALASQMLADNLDGANFNNLSILSNSYQAGGPAVLLTHPRSQFTQALIDGFSRPLYISGDQDLVSGVTALQSRKGFRYLRKGPNNTGLGPDRAGFFNCFVDGQGALFDSTFHSDYSGDDNYGGQSGDFGFLVCCTGRRAHEHGTYFGANASLSPPVLVTSAPPGQEYLIGTYVFATDDRPFGMLFFANCILDPGHAGYKHKNLISSREYCCSVWGAGYGHVDNPGWDASLIQDCSDYHAVGFCAKAGTDPDAGHAGRHIISTENSEFLCDWIEAVQVGLIIGCNPLKGSPGLPRNDRPLRLAANLTWQGWLRNPRGLKRGIRFDNVTPAVVSTYDGHVVGSQLIVNSVAPGSQPLAAGMKVDIAQAKVVVTIANGVMTVIDFNIALGPVFVGGTLVDVTILGVPKVTQQLTQIGAIPGRLGTYAIDDLTLTIPTPTTIAIQLGSNPVIQALGSGGTTGAGDVGSYPLSDASLDGFANPVMYATKQQVYPLGNLNVNMDASGLIKLIDWGAWSAKPNNYTDDDPDAVLTYGGGYGGFQPGCKGVFAGIFDATTPQDFPPDPQIDASRLFPRNKEITVAAAASLNVWNLAAETIYLTADTPLRIVNFDNGAGGHRRRLVNISQTTLVIGAVAAGTVIGSVTSTGIITASGADEYLAPGEERVVTLSDNAGAWRVSKAAAAATSTPSILPQVSKLASDISSSANGVIDTGLSVVLVGNATYRVRGTIWFQLAAANVAGLKLGILFTHLAAGGIRLKVPAMAQPDKTALEKWVAGTDSCGGPNATVTQPLCAEIDGLISTDALGGTLKVQFASTVAGQQVTVLAVNTLLVAEQLGGGFASVDFDDIARGVAISGQIQLTASVAIPAGHPGWIGVFVNSLELDPGVDYTVDGTTTVTLTSALSAGDKWRILHRRTA